MVGVPGRSKGCSTCRRRKKGCDKKRPICTQCSSAGLVCGSYERERIFLNQTTYTRGTKVMPAPVVYQKGASQASDSVTDITLPKCLARTAYIEKYISIFMLKYLPISRTPAAPSIDASHDCDWIEIAHGLHTSDKIIQLSLLSLGLFAVGESRYAIQAYCSALHKFQTSLCLPSPTRNKSALATCQLFSLLEILYGADEDVLLQGFKWHSHLNGILAIINTGTPHAFQSGASHELFCHARYPLLISAIRNRQRFPLNSAEWRTIPWGKEPKTLMDILHDIMADLSVILADADEMRHCSDFFQKANLRRAVLSACWCLDESLRNWLKKAGPLTSFPNSEDIVGDPTCRRDLPGASITLVYWTISIILYATLISIHDPPLSDIPIDIDPRPYIQSVANALPYFWREGAGVCNAYLAASPWGFSLQVAYATPHHYPEEIALLEQLILNQNVSNTVLPFLQSLQSSSAGLEVARIKGKEGIILRAQRWMMGIT